MNSKASVNKTEILLRQRIKCLMLFRVVLATLFLGLPLLLQLEILKNPWSVTTFYFLMAAICFLTMLYTVFLQNRSPSLVFVLVQLGFDLLLEATLIAVTGGLGSPFTFLFIVTIVSASIFFHQRGGVIMSGIATAFFCGMALLQRMHFPPFETSVRLGNNEVLYGLFLYMIAFFTVGIISGRLAKRLHEKEIGFLDLRIFNEDIAQSMPSGLITTDLLGRITSFNRSATAITGYAPEEVLGRSWWQHFDWEGVQSHYKNLALSGTPQRFEGEVVTKNGKPRLLGVTISALRNERGKQLGIIGTFQDLTEIRNLEEAIQKKERLAMIGEMAAGMAHEIRNPLASLSGSIQVLRDELSLRGENLLLMEIAMKDTERLSSFVTQFLHYARPIPPQRRWVNLETLLSEIIQLLQNDPAYDPSRFHVVLEKHGASTMAFVDPDQMKQVFWNLGHNAYQAMAGGGELGLSVRPLDEKTGKEQVEVLFSDTGTGILEEDFFKIFDPFFTTKSEGSGLGLAIVQRVVEEHAGRISVESEPGKTVFRMILPLGSEPTEAPHDMMEIEDHEVLKAKDVSPLTSVEP